MSETETKYKVTTEYVATDHSSEVLERIEKHAEEAAESVEKLKEGLKMAAEAIGLRELVSKTAETFIGFNSAVEATKIKLSALIGANFHANWKRATSEADEMYEKFEKFAEIAPVSAQEMAAFGQTVTGAVLAAGGGMKDLVKITEQGAIATKAMGGSAEELNRLLAGQVSNRSIWGKMMLGTMGTDAAHWKKMTAQQRLSKTEGALGSDTMKDATGALRESFGGAVAMFKDKIEVALGKVGLPLFKEVTKEVRSWGEWIDKHPEKIREITDKMTSGIKEAMSMLRDVGTFLYPLIKEAMSVVGDVIHFISEHRDMITGVIKGLLIYKGVGIAGSVAGGIGGGASGLFGSLSKVAGELGKSFTGLKEALGSSSGGTTDVGGLFKGLGSAIGPLISGAGSFVALGTVIYGLTKALFGETHDEKVRREHSEQIGLKGADWMKDYKERKALMDQRKALIAGGMDPTSSYQGITQRLTQLHGNREDLMRAGINEGVIKETVENGIRRLELDTSKGAMSLNPQDSKLFVSSLKQAFLEVYNEKEAAYDADGSLTKGDRNFRYKDRGFGATGAFEEDVNTDVEKKEKELESRVPVQQTVNVVINQVSAKDPDRWLADVDDMAGRLINRPRRAKSSIARKMGDGF